MSQRSPLDAHTAKQLFLERAAAYYDELNAATENAPYGQTFNHAEAFVVNEGRELLRSSLETIMQANIDELEKKKETKKCQKCQTKKRHRGYRNKNRLSAVGNITPFAKSPNINILALSPRPL